MQHNKKHNLMKYLKHRNHKLPKTVVYYMQVIGYLLTC